MRLRNTIANRVLDTLLTAKIYWESEWQEYRVVLDVNGIKMPNATYHTEWYDDALGTAYAMVKLPRPYTEDKEVTK